MSHHHKLRKDQTCLNCGHQVEERYCTHCGQENVEPRQPFHYLFGHFIEDLTHYDHGFWETFKTLMVRPGKLIKNYLAGKRQSQVPPVKLYIFVSFLAFFLPAILPEHKENVKEKEPKKEIAITHKEQAVTALKKALEVPALTDAARAKLSQSIDSIQNGKNSQQLIDSILESNSENDKDVDDVVKDIIADTGYSVNLSKYYKGFKTVHEIDSIQNSLPADKKPNIIAYAYQKKYVELREEGMSNKEITEKIGESLIHNLPKLLFFYLPLFAFFMWLFHSKKKWLYFDHGIFTLYYFSFILTCAILFELITWLGGFVDINLIAVLKGVAIAFLWIYPFLYFFLAQHRVYGGSRVISVAKGIVLFFINMIFMSIFALGYLALISYMLH